MVQDQLPIKIDTQSYKRRRRTRYWNGKYGKDTKWKIETHKEEVVDDEESLVHIEA